MILYKYISYQAMKKILATNTIGFAKAHSFNDPFELQAGYPVSKEENEIELAFSELLSEGNRQIWNSNSGILCLTRSSNNPLMWAHYADEHQGVVIGIDVEKAGFLDTDRCIIPAHLGNVIYTNTVPTHKLVIDEENDKVIPGSQIGYLSEQPDLVHRLFLYKPSYWAYEEEVRVVKNLRKAEINGTNGSGSFKIIKVNRKRLYCFYLPKDCFVSVQFGLRHPFSINKSDDELNELKENFPQISFSGTSFIKNSWGLKNTIL